MHNGISHPDLYVLLKEAVIDGLKKVEEAKDTGQYIGKYYEFPKLGVFRSGLPSFSKCFDDSPLQYSDLFGPSDKTYVTWGDIPSWNAFRDCAESDPFLRNFLFGEFNSGYARLPDDWNTQYYTYGTVSHIVDRFIHLAGKTQFDESTFNTIYREWESSVYSKVLHFDICVPILCNKFDFDVVHLNEQASIERMGNDFQLARNVQLSFKTSAHKAVVGAATHALVLNGWTVKNLVRTEREVILYEFSAFSEAIPIIDNFFAALRIVEGNETGYCQLVIRPVGWGDIWKAFLPPVYVVSTRAYPDHFEDFGWLRNAPITSINSTKAIAEVYRVLTETAANNLAIAARRLNAAHLRKDETDSILDITIALEALLGDDSKSEMTHKLAMRMAALATIEPCSEGEPAEIFGFVKKIYAYRSTIVHGSKKSPKKLTVANKRNEEIPTVNLGLKLLRHAIFALSRHQEFLDPKKLDQHLISTCTKSTRI